MKVFDDIFNLAALPNLVLAKLRYFSYRMYSFQRWLTVKDLRLIFFTPIDHLQTPTNESFLRTRYSFFNIHGSSSNTHDTFSNNLYTFSNTHDTFSNTLYTLSNTLDTFSNTLDIFSNTHGSCLNTHGSFSNIRGSFSNIRGSFSNTCDSCSSTRSLFSCRAGICTKMGTIDFMSCYYSNTKVVSISHDMICSFHVLFDHFMIIFGEDHQHVLCRAANYVSWDIICIELSVVSHETTEINS